MSTISPNAGQRQHGKAPFKIAGPAIRALFAAATAADPPLKSSEKDVVLAIGFYLGGYSKISDKVSLGQLGEVACLHPKTVSRVMRSFNGRDDIPIKWTSGGKFQGDCSVIELTLGEPHAIPLKPEFRGTKTSDSNQKTKGQPALNGSRATGKRRVSEKPVNPKDLKPSEASTDVVEEKVEDPNPAPREEPQPEPLIAMTERTADITSRPASKDARRNEGRRMVLHCREGGAGDLLIDQCIGLAAEREVEYVSGVLATIRKVAEEDHGIIIPHLQLRGGTQEDRDPEAEAREKRKRAIESCGLCDDNGHLLVYDEVARCLHGAKPAPEAKETSSMWNPPEGCVPMPDDFRNQWGEFFQGHRVEKIDREEREPEYAHG